MTNPLSAISHKVSASPLPITEETGLPFASQNVGVMHACGHDIHIACLLGVARVLQNMRQQIKGTVLLVFQPCEESIPGGANLMLRDGVFADYEPQMVIAQHVYPELEVGQFGFHKGEYLASADEVIITCNSKPPCRVRSSDRTEWPSEPPLTSRSGTGRWSRAARPRGGCARGS